jgi:protein-tyrosine phosphatase
MLFALFFLVLAALLFAQAAALGGVGWLLLWPASSFGLVGLGYLGVGPRVLGKREHGSRAPWARLLHAPFFAFSRLGWLSLRLLRNEACSNEVAPGLHVGRLCSVAELPGGVDLVVDLTSEFVESQAVRAKATYRCVPTLDGLAPPQAAFVALVAEVAGFEGTVYVHCAFGHGRAATFAAAVLVARGLAADMFAAEALMKTRRPAVRLSRAQRRLAHRLAAMDSKP